MERDTGHDRFREAVEKAGGTVRVLWSAKKDPKARYDDIYYLAVYGPQNKTGQHPLVGGVIVNEFDEPGHYELLRSSQATSVEKDIAELFAPLTESEGDDPDHQ
jgi:hypothetical protein